MQVTFVIPCYNEPPEVVAGTLARLRETLARCISLQYEILVVDDGSDKHCDPTDITAPRTRLIRHEHNRGYGASLATGIRNSQYEWIGIIDADGTYPVEHFPELLEQAEACSMVVGARQWKDIPPLRRLPKRVINRMAGFIADAPIPDLNSGMRLFKKEIVQMHPRIFPNGFSFTATLTMICLSNFYPVRFVNIPYGKRSGRSKISPFADTARFLAQILRLSLYFRPLRFFVPLTALILLLALARGIRDIVVTNHFGGLTLILAFMAFQVFFFGLIAEIINKK